MPTRGTVSGALTRNENKPSLPAGAKSARYSENVCKASGLAIFAAVCLLGGTTDIRHMPNANSPTASCATE
jgi:hypothetical protein